MSQNESLFCISCDAKVFDPLLERIDMAGDRYQLKASCPTCGRYIKFLGQGGPPKLFFGKYKNQEIAEVAKKDRDYLLWLIEQDWCKPKLKAMVEEVLAK